MSRAVHTDDKIYNILAKANYVFGRPRSTVWVRRGIKLTTKIKVYMTVVISLLYACETWTVYARHARQKNALMIMIIIRRFLNIM